MSVVTDEMVEKATRIIRPNVCATDPCDGPEVDDCACRKKAIDVLNAFAADIAAAEREACARICDDADKSTHPADLAAAIRARKDTP